MPNRLKMSKIKSILTLRQQGWSFTRIARELRIHRQTVARHIQEHSKASQAPTGTDGPKPSKTPTGSGDSRSTKAPRRSPSHGMGRSDCEPLRLDQQAGTVVRRTESCRATTLCHERPIQARRASERVQSTTCCRTPSLALRACNRDASSGFEKRTIRCGNARLGRGE